MYNSRIGSSSQDNESILNDDTDFGFDTRDPKWYEALEEFKRPQLNFQNINPPQYNSVQIEERSIYVVNNDESNRANFSVHSFESMSDISLSPTVYISKRKKKIFNTKAVKSPKSAAIRQSMFMKTKSRNITMNSDNISTLNVNDNDNSLESFFKRPSINPSQRFFKKPKPSEDDVFLGAIEMTLPKSKNSSLNDSLVKVKRPKLFSKKNKLQSGIFSNFSNSDFSESNQFPDLNQSQNRIEDHVSIHKTNYNTNKESLRFSFDNATETKKSFFKNSTENNNGGRIVDSIFPNKSHESININNYQANVLAAEQILLENKIQTNLDKNQEFKDSKKISDDENSIESVMCMNYSHHSIASETINYDKFKQLMSSTVIGGEMSPKVSHLRNMKQNSRKISVIEENDIQMKDIEDLDDIEESLSEKNLVLSFNPDVGNKSSHTNKSNHPNEELQIEILEINNKENQISRSNSDDTSQKVKQIQSSKTFDDLVPEFSSSEKTASLSVQLNQSEIDRAVIEEMKAKRTNPPVRRSTIIPRSQSLSTNSDNDAIDDVEFKNLPLRHSNIPILPINMNNDNETMSDQSVHTNISNNSIHNDEHLNLNEKMDDLQNFGDIKNLSNKENVENVISSNNTEKSKVETAKSNESILSQSIHPNTSYNSIHNDEHLNLNEKMDDLQNFGDIKNLSNKENVENVISSNNTEKSEVETAKSNESIPNQSIHANTSYDSIHNDEQLNLNEKMGDLQNFGDIKNLSNKENVENVISSNNTEKSEVETAKTNESIPNQSIHANTSYNSIHNEKHLNSNEKMDDLPNFGDINDLSNKENVENVISSNNTEKSEVETAKNNESSENRDEFEETMPLQNIHHFEEKSSVKNREDIKLLENFNFSNELLLTKNKEFEERTILKNIDNHRKQSLQNKDNIEEITVSKSITRSGSPRVNNMSHEHILSEVSAESLLENKDDCESNVSVENKENLNESIQNEKLNSSIKSLIIKNKNLTRNTDQDMEFTIIDDPEDFAERNSVLKNLSIDIHEFVEQKNNTVVEKNGNFSNQSDSNTSSDFMDEFSRDSLENPHIDKKQLPNILMNNSTESTNKSNFFKNPKNYSNSNRNLVKDISNMSALSTSASSLQLSHASFYKNIDPKMKEILMSKYLSPDSKSEKSINNTKQKENDSVPYSTKILTENDEKILKWKELLKKSMETRKKRTEETVKKMFEQSENNKNVMHLETPWNLLEESKKRIKLSNPKSKDLPIPVNINNKPKLYMKEKWITKRLYDFIENKLQPKHGFYALAKSEEFIVNLAKIVNTVLKSKKDSNVHVLALKTEMAQLEIISTHYDFHHFVRNYLPFHFRLRAIPACGRNIPDIEGDIFDNILE